MFFEFSHIENGQVVTVRSCFIGSCYHVLYHVEQGRNKILFQMTSRCGLVEVLHAKLKLKDIREIKKH